MRPILKESTIYTLFFLLTALLTTHPLFGQFSGGSGTEGNPFHIANAADLAEVRNYLDANFIQTGDVDLSAYDNWEPIGDSDNPFTGTFDGNHYSITNLTIDREDESSIGLFGTIGLRDEGLTVENISLQQVDITGNNSVGTLVGTNFGRVSRIAASGQVKGNGDVGGLIGENWELVEESKSTCDVSGEYNVGGLVGANAFNVRNTYASGTVSGDNRIGGLVGIIAELGSVWGSYATGEVIGEDMTGGLIGLNVDGSVGSSYWDINTSGLTETDGGTGLTTDQMTGPDALEYMEGFDFENIWDVAGSYPFHRWDDPFIWTFFIGSPIVSSPFVGSTVYVGSSDNNLYAIDEETGDEKWSFTTGDEVFSSPVLYNDAVFVGSDDSNLYAVDAGTGDELWSFETGDDVRSSPAATPEMVYVGSDDNHIYAVDIETGLMEWSYETGDAVGSSPAVAGGLVYVGSGDGNVYALDVETGDMEWSFETGSAVFSSPAVSGGIVYVGSDDGNLYALEAMTGDESWSFTTGGAVRSSPAVGDDLVFAGSDDNHLYAVNSETGEEVWSYETGGSVFSSPEVAYEAVFVGSNDGRLYALEAATGGELWDMLTGGPVRSSPAVAYGNVYVGSDDGSLYSTELDVPTSAPEYVENIPEEYTLYQNYPNPFNPATTIRFSLPEAVEVVLVVYDILGRKVTTLVDEYREPGEHSVLFNAGHLSSGVYLYQLRALVPTGDDHFETKRLMLVK